MNHVGKRRVAMLCWISVMFLTGCEANNTQQNATPTAPAGVVDALPKNIAGPRQDIRIAHQDRPPVIMAVAYGGQVRMHSGSKWHGRNVDLYYIPASNIRHMGNHLELASARNVQHLVHTQIGTDGTWRAVWNHGNYGIPKHTPFFIMARDDKGEIGLVQINTIN